jgi:hypothetical protein
VEVEVFLTSALGGGEWSDSCPGRFVPGFYWLGGRMGLGRAGEEKKIYSPPLLGCKLGRPACRLVIDGAAPVPNISFYVVCNYSGNSSEFIIEK